MTTRKPFFTIVIPTLNEQAYIPTLLSNLSKQTTKDFEVIVVDGNSKDKTIQKTLEFKSKLPSLSTINSKKRHQSHQRNLGANQAQGRYILFIDADTSLPKYFLEGMRYNLRRKPSDVFTSWCKPSTNKNQYKAIAQLVNIAIEAGKLLDYPAGLGAYIGCKTSIFEKTGKFNTKYNFGEDGEFLRKAQKKGYIFEVYKDPVFTFSVRRWEKGGYVKTLAQYAKIKSEFLLSPTESQDKLKKEYKMGGHVFNKDKKTKNLFKRIDETIEKIQNKPKLIKKLQNKIRQLSSF